MKRILFVDDEPMLLRLYSDTVPQLGDYEVMTSDDGEKALEIINQLDGDLDLVVTDCNRSGINGIELGEIIKKQHPEIPIVMITGYLPKAEAAAPPGVFYSICPKPIRLKKLEEIIRAAILSKERT